MNWDSSYKEVRYELDGLLPRGRKILLPNIKIENYDEEGYRGCDIRLRLADALDTNIFIESQKIVMAVCTAVAYVHNLGFTIGSGEGDEGVPKGYAEADASILWANGSSAQALLLSIYSHINANDIYHIQPGIYFTKAVKFRFDDYEQAMNVVRFIECVAFALRVKTGERNVDVKLTIAANKQALLDIGITEEEWQSLIELNQLRNQLAGHGVMLPDTEDLFQVPITRPRYYEATPGPIYTVGSYVGARMPVVRKLFSLYYGCEPIDEELFIYQQLRTYDS